MCFSATANFVGSGVLGAVGVVTLTKVKHRRELLFASLPVLFAIHQFIEGFVWLGLDGILSPTVTHDMGAAFMLYAQGLLPFLLPLSVLLFEPNGKSRMRMLPFLAARHGNHALYPVGVDGVSVAGIRQGKQHRVHQSSDEQYGGRGAVCDCNLRVAVLFQSQGHGNFWRGQHGDSTGGNGVQTVRVHLAMVCVRCGGECDHTRLFLEKQRRPASPLRVAFVGTRSRLVNFRELP